MNIQVVGTEWQGSFLIQVGRDAQGSIWYRRGEGSRWVMCAAEAVYA